MLLAQEGRNPWVLYEACILAQVPITSFDTGASLFFLDTIMHQDQLTTIHFCLNC
eukprot:CAMPEP_0172822002 /NCGR_PEP_ID=MMETSP1075-20121228/16381_1 /TAXON_ID=2916 /ORGANISM="Ceratium fusus, Strain PA161109" /LENGTH=54 /DNA_ID=CAMNT_0013662943 /DNA_START=115 /DNA_END=276 /DNA_ORIENTATION=+